MDDLGGSGRRDGRTNTANTFGFVALEWLLWPERVVARRAHLAVTRADDAQHGLVGSAFRERLSSRYRDMKLDDIHAACGALFAQCTQLQESKRPILPWLYRQCLEERSLSISFFGGTPTISHGKGDFMSWLELADRLDSDVLAGLVLAERAHEADSMSEAERLVESWPLVFGSADGDLADLGRRGLTDLHIHFTSLWPVALSWQRVLRYADDKAEGKSLVHLSAIERLDSKCAERKCIENVAGHKNGARPRMPQLAKLRPHHVRFFGADRITSQPIGGVLAPERTMLLRAWHALLDYRGSQGTAHSWEARSEIEAELDEYIVAKSVFRNVCAQRLHDTSKGLVAFDEIRRGNAHLGVFDREETKGGLFSGSRFRRNKAYLVAALRDCSALRRAEVRIAPPSVSTTYLARAYCKTMLASDKLLRDSRLHNNAIDIRVALHFKRALGEKSRIQRRDRLAGRPTTMPLLRKLLEFDRDTATFHNYRLHVVRSVAASPGRRSKEDAAALQRFSRFDLASPERGAGPWAIAPYVRLLRGDPDTLREVATKENTTYFAKWKVLARQGRMHLPLGAPAVRVTCHAGEDFYTLIDGLRHIDSAISDWRMTKGDALGHCLALGLSASRYVDSHDRVRIPVGVELDSFVWLRRTLMAAGLGGAIVLHDLEDAICRLAFPIYGGGAPHFRPDGMLLDLTRKIERSAEPVLVPAHMGPAHLPVAAAQLYASAVDGGESLRLLDHFDVEVTARRSTLKIPDSVHSRLIDVVAGVQNLIVDRIRCKGIVIETNPSSNMRMERIGHPSALPIWSIARSGAEPPPITIATDNPGTYDTNVEIEYAVMHSALLNTLGRTESAAALSHLDTMRLAGHRLFDDIASPALKKKPRN